MLFDRHDLRQCHHCCLIHQFAVARLEAGALALAPGRSRAEALAFADPCLFFGFGWWRAQDGLA
jgi:hypothetical protein